MSCYDSLSLYELIGNANDPQAHILQGLRHWLDMTLAQQFPFREIDPFQLIYMSYLSIGCQNMEVRGICIVNLPLTFSVLIETFAHSETFLTFMVFIEVCNLKACNFIKKRLQHRCSPAKFAKFLRALAILKNIYERLLLIFLNFNS